VTQLSGLFQAPSVIRATLQAVREREDMLRANYQRDGKHLQARMDALKAAVVNGEIKLDEIKQTSEQLLAVKRNLRQLKDPISEEEIIAALGDAGSLWKFMFPGVRNELIQMMVGEIVVYTDKISMILKIDGMKDLAAEMTIGGYFKEPHDDPNVVPVGTQEILDDGSIRITVGLTLKRANGHRKTVVKAAGSEQVQKTALLRAIKNSRNWTEMLINGEAKNVRSLARQLEINHSHVSRILTLTAFAPDIVESIVAGTEPDNLSIAKLTAQPLPNNGNEQRRVWRGAVEMACGKCLQQRLSDVFSAVFQNNIGG